MTKIFFLPARMLTSAMFSKVAEMLPGYDIVFPDLYSDDTIKAMSDRTILSLENDEKVVFVGISMGGYVALDIAHRYPNHVQGMVLTATNARTDSEQLKQMRLKEIELADQLFDKQMNDMTKQLLSPVNENNEELNSFILNETRLLGKEVFKRQQKAILSRENQTVSLSKIDFPVLVIGGSEDKITSPSLLKELHDNISNSEIHFIDGAGHLSPLEKPKEYVNLLKKFLKQLI